MTGYRKDIDGLRCLAVWPVVLFHAGFQAFDGGFVGVDVFFVISGFLITGTIRREIETGTFSFRHFYERRVRRILPAAVVMLAATIATGIAISLPPDARDLAHSALASVFSLANIYFYWRQGYFDGSGENAPLLHMWSLGVEEQFYLLFPLILVFLGQKSARVTWIWLGGGMLASFLASWWWTHYDASAAFYLLPFRAWELGLGALLALMPPSLGNGRVSAIANAFGALVGLAMIAIAVLLFDRTTPFPGLAALLPCTGAVLLLATGARATPVSRILSWAPLRFFGLISYSLYLWHWPVLVFGRTIAVQSLTVRVIEVVLAIALATLSWHFVEQPFRNSQRRSRRKALAFVGVASLGITAVAGAIAVLDGWPQRFAPRTTRLASFLDYDPRGAYREGTCFVTDRTSRDIDFEVCLARQTSRPNVLVLGDSHAAQLWAGLNTRVEELHFSQVTMASCRLTRSSLAASDEQCRRLARRVYRDILPGGKVDAVLLAGAWRRSDLRDIERTLIWMKRQGVPVLLIGRGTTYDNDLPRLLALAEQRQDDELVDRHRARYTATIDNQLAQIAARIDVPFQPLTSLECHAGNCTTLVAVDVPVRFDRGHLTEQGSNWLAGLIHASPVMRQFIAELL